MKTRTLAALAIVALLVGGVLALDVALVAPSTQADVSLVKLNSEIAKITIEGQGRARLVLERAEGSLRIASPGFGLTDVDAIERLRDALRYLTYRRRVDKKQARGLRQPRLILSIEFVDGHALTLAIGANESRYRRTWLSSSADPDAAFLVESYQAEALDVDANSLRSRDVFSVGEKPITRIELKSVADTWLLTGNPPCLLLKDGCVRVDADLAASLQDSVRSLQISRFVGPTSEFKGAITGVVVNGERLMIGGPCPGAAGERITKSRLGFGCVSALALERAAPEVSSAADWVDRRLVRSLPQDVRRISIQEAATEIVIALEGEAWIRQGAATQAVSSSAVRSWLRELDTLQASHVQFGRPASSMGAPTILLEQAQGSRERLTLVRRLPGDRVAVQRDREPASLVVDGDTVRFFSTAPFQFRDRVLLSFDPFLLTAIEVRSKNARVAVTRTQAMEIWSTAGAVTVDQEAVLALRDAASELRAERYVADVARPLHGLRPPRHAVTLLVEPSPTGPAEPAQKFTVELGERTKTGTCYASVAGDAHVALLAKDSCDALVAPLTSP